MYSEKRTHDFVSIKINVSRPTKTKSNDSREKFEGCIKLATPSRRPPLLPTKSNQGPNHCYYALTLRILPRRRLSRPLLLRPWPPSVGCWGTTGAPKLLEAGTWVRGYVAWSHGASRRRDGRGIRGELAWAMAQCRHRPLRADAVGASQPTAAVAAVAVGGVPLP